MFHHFLKYKSSLIENKNGATIAVPLKYLSNFSRSLEMPLINSKIHLELSWTKNCVMSNIAGDTTFQITSTKLYVPIVTLSTKDNVKLTKQFNEGFKISVHWNEYKSKIETKAQNTANDFLLMLLFKELIDSLFLLLIIILLIMAMMVLVKFKERNNKNIYSQELKSQNIMY